MKTIKKVVGLFLAILLMSSCANEPDPDIYEYQPIYFTFQDVSGKDLVREVVEPLLVYQGDDEFLTLSENFYSLKVIYPHPCMDPVEAANEQCRKSENCWKLDEPNSFTPRFYVDWYKEQDYWEMFFIPITSDQCSKTKMLTLQIQSPIFGDDQKQEIVLHFDGLKVSKIFFNDNECPFIQQTINGFTLSRIPSNNPKTVEVAYTAITL